MTGYAKLSVHFSMRSYWQICLICSINRYSFAYVVVWWELIMTKCVCVHNAYAGFWEYDIDTFWHRKWTKGKYAQSHVLPTILCIVQSLEQLKCTRCYCFLPARYLDIECHTKTLALKMEILCSWTVFRIARIHVES